MNTKIDRTMLFYRDILIIMIMQIQLGLLLFIVFTPLLLQSVIAQDQDFLHYKNTDLGIEIDYPSSWEKMEFGEGFGIAFHVPLESNEQIFSETVGVLPVSHLPSTNESPDQYFDKLIEDFTKEFPDYQIASGPHKVTLNEYPAQQIFFRHVEGKDKFDTMEIWTLKGDRAFQIEASVKGGKYSNFPPEHILDMVRSFRILP